MSVESLLKERLINESNKLYQMYHNDNLSLTDIGEQYGCTRQYIQLIFKELGIERRPRLLALKNRRRRHRSKYDFSDLDDLFIRENFHRMTDDELAGKLAKPHKAVTYRRLFVLKCKKIARRNFTKTENQFICRNYRKLSDRKIAKVLGRPLVSITHHRNSILKKTKRAHKAFSPNENFFIIENYRKMTDEQIAAVLKRSKTSVTIHRGGVLRLYKQGESLGEGL